jgi:hypothetical protein
VIEAQACDELASTHARVHVLAGRARTVAGMTPKRAQIDSSPAARLLVVGLVVAAAGMPVQSASGVDYPTIPPGPIILLVAAAVVAFGPWRWAPAVGLAATVFISIGGVIATIAGNGFALQLSDPGAVGGFVGTLVQIAGPVIALAAGIGAARPNVGSAAATPPYVARRLRPAS